MHLLVCVLDLFPSAVELSWAAQLWHIHSRTSEQLPLSCCLLWSISWGRGSSHWESDGAGWAVFHAQGYLPEEILLLGSTCTQLMDALVQHGRDVALGEVKAVRLFSFTCLFLFHGNNEFSLWSTVRKSLCPESNLPLFVCENMETQESSSNLSYFSCFSTQERTPYHFFPLSFPESIVREVYLAKPLTNIRIY